LKAADKSPKKKGIVFLILCPFFLGDFRRFEPAQKPNFESRWVYTEVSFLANFFWVLIERKKMKDLCHTFLFSNSGVMKMSAIYDSCSASALHKSTDDASEKDPQPKAGVVLEADLLKAIKNGGSCPTCFSQINVTSVQGVSLSPPSLDEAAGYTSEDDLPEMNYSTREEGFSDFETGSEQAIDLEQIGEPL
jgi:hypothetical protein